jgi:hypothetical protein
VQPSGLKTVPRLAKQRTRFLHSALNCPAINLDALCVGAERLVLQLAIQKFKD